MDEFERYPNLMNVVLGIPQWVKHLRTLNNLNTLAAIILAIVVGFSQSFGSGLVYAAIYFIGWLVVAGIGSFLVQQGSMVGSIIIATVVLVTLNIVLTLYFFGIWSPF